MDTVKDRLKDVISEGVAIDIFHAEEALALDKVIGREADKINTATFGAFFGSLQIILGRQLILAVSRIFEREGDHYKVRSIPAAIKVLREGADELSVDHRTALIKAMLQCGFDPVPLERSTDPEITRLVADHFEKTMPRAGLGRESEGLSRALGALKMLRDKFVAHPEAIKVEDLPKATLVEIDQLLEFAKFFAITIGRAYLSTTYVSDAGRAGRCLERVLEAAGVLERPNHA